MTPVRRGFWRDVLYEDGSYKLVALFVTLVLWMTILGRRDRVAVEELNVQVTVAQGFEVTRSVNKTVKVRLSGPGSSLKRFQRNPEPVMLNVDRVKPGRNVVQIRRDDLSLPLGVKVLEIQPSEIEIEVQRVGQGEDRGEATKR